MSKRDQARAPALDWTLPPLDPGHAAAPGPSHEGWSGIRSQESAAVREHGARRFVRIVARGAPRKPAN
jgi:hypothetical protein